MSSAIQGIGCLQLETEGGSNWTVYSICALGQKEGSSILTKDLLVSYLQVVFLSCDASELCRAVISGNRLQQHRRVYTTA